MFESFEVMARSPARMMCTASVRGSPTLLFTLPRAAEDIIIYGADGKLCLQWDASGDDGLWQQVSVRGLKRCVVQYFMRPVLDTGNLYMVMPELPTSIIVVNVVLNGSPFSLAAHERSLLQLSPAVRSSPAWYVVCVFCVCLIATVVCALVL